MGLQPDSASSQVRRSLTCRVVACGLTSLALTTATFGCAGQIPSGASSRLPLAQLSAALKSQNSPGALSLAPLPVGEAGAGRFLAGVQNLLAGTEPVSPAAIAVPEPIAPVAKAAPTATADRPTSATEKPADPIPAVTMAENDLAGDRDSPDLGLGLGTMMPPPPPIFEDGFEDGMAQWLSRGAGLPSLLANPDDPGWHVASQDARLGQSAAVLNGFRSTQEAKAARRSLWLKSKSVLDLRASQQPRLRLFVKGSGGEATSRLKAIWETEGSAYVEETLIGSAVPDGKDWDAKEFDLSRFKDRPGRLILVARAPRGVQGEAGPMLDEVRIVDTAGAQPSGL